MNNVIYTYHDRVPGFVLQEELVRIWENAWRRQGWNPVLLGHRDAMKHSDYESYLRHIKRYASCNPDGYDRACWLRWLAFAVVGGGLMSDYDVLPRNIEPESICCATPVILEQYRVPCLVCSSDSGASQIVADIFKFAPQSSQAHTSDMLFFQSSGFRHQSGRIVCAEFGHQNWESSQTVHFATNACHQAGMSKQVAMKRFAGYYYPSVERVAHPWSQLFTIPAF